MQLSNSIFENEAQGARFLVLSHDALKDVLGIVLILLVAQSCFFLDDANTYDFVSIVHEFSQQPLEGIVGVCVLVNSNHESS